MNIGYGRLAYRLLRARRALTLSLPLSHIYTIEHWLQGKLISLLFCNAAPSLVELGVVGKLEMVPLQ